MIVQESVVVFIVIHEVSSFRIDLISRVLLRRLVLVQDVRATN